jgi:hypothetical protein
MEHQSDQFKASGIIRKTPKLKTPKLTKKQVTGVIISSIVFVATMSFMVYPIQAKSSPILLYPRLGSAIQGPRTLGPGLNTTNFLEETMTVWVGLDPAEAMIPFEWYNQLYWSVALIPNAMSTANCTELIVVDVISGVNLGSVFGMGLDVSTLYSSAAGLVCRIPADISPLVYNLAIGFNEPINSDRQKSAEIDLIPKIGSWRSSNLDSFLLVDANCVAIPWEYDAFSGEDPNKLTPSNNKINPFTLMHVTDTHFSNWNPDYLIANENWLNDTQVLAPDLITISGDLMEHPATDLTDFEVAYNHLSTANAPFIIGNGNHDQYLLGPWRYYFGNVLSTTRFDDVSIVSFDTTLPFASGQLSWIEKQAQQGIQSGPTFIMGHYPLEPGYFSSGWWGIAEMMLRYNITGYLTGHSHDDMTVDLNSVIQALLANPSEEGLMQFLVDTYSSDSHLYPIQSPMMLMTRTAAKNGTVMSQDDYPIPLEHYSGYRKLTITNNFVNNYTYDYDGDGIRDPQISTPSGLLKTYSYWETGIGVNPSAGAMFRLENLLNEEIRGARAIFTVPTPPTGMQWDLSTLNKTNGAFIRAQITNGTHCWIDARLYSPAQSLQWLRLEAV